MALRHQRCWNHEAREAAVRCPLCKRHFCRECVTEHDERLLCAGCLNKLVRRGSRNRGRLAWARRALSCAFGMLVAWVVFYTMGQLLPQIPTPPEEGAAWHRR